MAGAPDEAENVATAGGADHEVQTLVDQNLLTVSVPCENATDSRRRLEHGSVRVKADDGRIDQAAAPRLGLLVGVELPTPMIAPIMPAAGLSGD